jgi:hypothetical protein
VHRTDVCAVEVSIHPRESFTIGPFARRWKMGTRQAAVQMSGEEQPAVVGIDVGKPALGSHVHNSGVIELELSRSHECERGTQECVRHGRGAA